MDLPVLTSSQERIARAVADFAREDRPAFVSDLVQELGLAGESSLTPTLKIMERKGAIEILGGGRQRAFRLIRLTDAGKFAMGLGVLPVLGQIPAGPLRESLAQSDDFVEADRLLASRPGDFLLRVSGDSMLGDGIYDGDLVLLRPDIDLRPGEIAAVHAGADYEGTLKHVHFERKQVRLKAGNPAFPDIIIPASEWRGVAGVYRGLVRNAGG